MKTLSAALVHSAVLLDHKIAGTEAKSATRTIPRAIRAIRPNRTPRIRSGAQAAMLVALGTLSSSLTLAYLMAKHPPLVLLAVAPLWSLWLLSFFDWLRGAVPGDLVSTAPAGRLSTRELGYVRSNDVATLSPCWQRVARSRAALGHDPGHEETSTSG